METGLLNDLNIGIIKGSSDIFKELKAAVIAEQKPVFYYYDTETKEVVEKTGTSSTPITVTVDASCYPQNANKRRV